jgi:hypothetical protein
MGYIITQNERKNVLASNNLNLRQIFLSNLQPIIKNDRTVVQSQKGTQKNYLNYKDLQSVIKVQVYCFISNTLFFNGLILKLLKHALRQLTKINIPTTHS